MVWIAKMIHVADLLVQVGDNKSPEFEEHAR